MRLVEVFYRQFGGLELRIKYKIKYKIECWTDDGTELVAKTSGADFDKTLCRLCCRITELQGLDGEEIDNIKRRFENNLARIQENGE